MNTLKNEAIDLVAGILKEIENYNGVDIVVCPPYTFIEIIIGRVKNSKLFVGAQNVFYEESGAYTGEISPLMLEDLGCKYIIIGHSERRRYFGETNPVINKKIKMIIKHAMTPIFCVGETLEQRREGKTHDILNSQIIYGFEGIDDFDIQKVVIAYEPVWAIGTGISATSAQAEETQKYIRNIVKSFAGEKASENIRIIYGGSVNTENALDLLKQEDIDGALIGGASLKADSFCEIIRIANSLVNL